MPRQQESELASQLKRSLCEQVIGVRDRRRVVEENWLKSRRAWFNTGYDARYIPSETGEGQYNIPAGRRGAERSIVRIVAALTPKTKWYETSPIRVNDPNVGNVDSFMNYILRKRIKTRSNIAMLARTAFMYGLCAQLTSVKVSNGQVWPSQRVVDPFAFYFFPETITDFSEAELLFEDFLMSYEEYKAQYNKGFFALDIKASDLDKPDWPYHLVERLAYQGITDPTANVESIVEQTKQDLQKTASHFVAMSLLWLRREGQLYQVYIVWNLKSGRDIASFSKSAYQQPLYRGVIHRALPGESYTTAMMDDVAELNILQNDQLNKFQESVNWEQGFALFNEAISGGGRKDHYKMKGRAKWELPDNPREMFQFVAPPVTSTNQLRAWQIYLSLINSMAGAGTIAEGQPGRNMPRAGFAMNALLEMGLADVKDLAELIEQEVLTPGLSDIYKVASFFIPEDQMMLVPGGQALYNTTQSSILKKENILGDYEFEWIGSLQSQDESMRAQRSMIFLNLLSNPQVIQTLQSQGYMPNLSALIQMIWRDSLGERGLKDVIVPVQQGTINNNNQQSAMPNGLGVPQLNYNLPALTNGFVQQR